LAKALTFELFLLLTLLDAGRKKTRVFGSDNCNFPGGGEAQTFEFYFLLTVMDAGRNKNRVFGSDNCNFRSTMWREDLPPKYRHCSYHKEPVHTLPFKVCVCRKVAVK
jgi:hypothetical protein